MKKFIKWQKLNQKGFGHHIILPTLVMVVVGAVGVYVLMHSKAAELPSTNSVTQTATNGRIALYYNNNSYTVKQSGDGTAQIGAGTQPRWSNDHTKLSRLNGKGQIIVSSADGTSAKTILPAGKFVASSVGPAVWRKDDDMLLFAAVESSDSQAKSYLFTVNPDGSGLKEVTSNGYDSIQDYQWSSNGYYIMFKVISSDSSGEPEYWIYRTSSSGGTEVGVDLQNADKITNHAIATDSSHYVVTNCAGRSCTMTVRNASVLTDVKKIASTDYFYDATWSPNSNAILYGHIVFDSNNNIVSNSVDVINSDGSGHKKLVTLPNQDTSHVLDWSPLANKVLFSTSGTYYVAPATTGGSINLSTNLGSLVSGISWRP